MQDVQKLKGWVVAAIAATVILGAVQGALIGGPIGFMIGIVVALVFGMATFVSTFVLLDIHRMVQQTLTRERLDRRRSEEERLPVGPDPDHSPRKS
jgi:hypothetical protein